MSDKWPRTDAVFVEMGSMTSLLDKLNKIGSHAIQLELENNELRKVIVELTAAGNCLRNDKDLLAGVIRNAGGHAHVQWSTDNWNNAKDWDRGKNGTI